MTTSYCDPTNEWTAAAIQLEEDVLALVNARRAEGASCGSRGNFAPAAPLEMLTTIRCAARVHSLEMAEMEFFSHTSPNGDSPGDRMLDAGWSGRGGLGENIAAGQTTAAAVMQSWMNSDGHCSNIMNPSFSYIGIGYYAGGSWGHYWTQTFSGQP